MGEKQDLLAKLRAARDAKGLSYQDIAEITEQNGESVSISTVRRVLNHDARIEDFRYNQTVRPIVNAVLGIGAETEEPDPHNNPEQAEQYYTQVEGLKSVIELKNEQLDNRAREIENLRAELADLKSNRRQEIEKVENADQRKIDYLKENIKDLKETIKDQKAEVKWYKRIITILGCACAIIAACLVVTIAIIG